MARTSKGKPKSPPTGRAAPPARRVAEAPLTETPHIGVGEFKAHCLEIMTRVSERHEEIVVTKRGMPLVRVVPVSQDIPGTFGYLRGTVVTKEDIVRPDRDTWKDHV